MPEAKSNLLYFFYLAKTLKDIMVLAGLSRVGLFSLIVGTSKNQYCFRDALPYSVRHTTAKCLGRPGDGLIYYYQ
jgi:hypothetical protein